VGHPGAFAEPSYRGQCPACRGIIPGVPAASDVGGDPAESFRANLLELPLKEFGTLDDVVRQCLVFSVSWVAQELHVVEPAMSDAAHFKEDVDAVGGGGYDRCDNLDPGPFLIAGDGLRGTVDFIV
jgi:hypothetical protein